MFTEQGVWYQSCFILSCFPLFTGKKTRRFLSRLKSTLFVARHIDLFHWALWSEEGKIFQVCRSTKSFFFNTVCLLKPFFSFYGTPCSLHWKVYIFSFLVEYPHEVKLSNKGDSVAIMQDSLVYKKKYYVIGKGVMHYIRLKSRKIFLWRKEGECLAFKEKRL